MPETVALVVAAGRGARMPGDIPKQYRDLQGRSILRHVLEAFSAHASVSHVQAVIHPDDAEQFAPAARGLGPGDPVLGGATRQESVRNGLAVVPDSVAIVLVHDGARPLASDSVFRGVIAAVADGADAAVPAVPVVDSIRHRAQGALDRSPLVAVQTPQGFVADRLRAAHASGADASDDATLVEADGGSVVVVDGDAANLKITSPLDLQIAELLLGESS